MPMTHAERQLVEIFEVTLPEMVRTRNIPGYVALFTEDGTWFPNAASDCFGRKQIARGLAELLSKEHIDPKFTAQKVWVRGNFGCVIGFSKETITPVDGSPRFVAWSREVWHFRRVNRVFRICCLIFNIKKDRKQLRIGKRGWCGSDRMETAR